LSLYCAAKWTYSYLFV